MSAKVIFNSIFIATFHSFFFILLPFKLVDKVAKLSSFCFFEFVTFLLK